MTKKIIDGIETHIELDGFTARHYDRLMDLVSLGAYPRFLKKVIRAMKLHPGDKALDLGCGTGRNLLLMANNTGESGALYGIDLGEEMLAQAKARFAGWKNVHLAQGSILEAYPFNETFDHITISFVLHGFSAEQRIQIVQNALQQLKPGGIFSFLDWIPMDFHQQPWWFRAAFGYIECPMVYEFIRHDYAHEFENSELTYHSETRHLMGFARLVQLKKAGE